MMSACGRVVPRTEWGLSCVVCSLLLGSGRARIDRRIAGDRADAAGFRRRCAARIHTSRLRRRYTRWGGFYAGGQAGYSASYMDFAKADRSHHCVRLRERRAYERVRHRSRIGPVLGTDTSKAPSLRRLRRLQLRNWTTSSSAWRPTTGTQPVRSANATRCYAASRRSNCSAAITLGDGNDYDATVTATASMRITDYGYGALRARLGRRQFHALCVGWLGGGRAESAATPPDRQRRSIRPRPA